VTPSFRAPPQGPHEKRVRFAIGRPPMMLPGARFSLPTDFMMYALGLLIC